MRGAMSNRFLMSVLMMFIMSLASTRCERTSASSIWIFLLICWNCREQSRCDSARLPNWKYVSMDLIIPTKMLLTPRMMFMLAYPMSIPVANPIADDRMMTGILM